MFVLGNAGHVDHGKSVLVHALTGIDPDRLREEKERGMTIDLGFAWLKLPSGREVGIIDVPGHERFIKNMLAGVGSIDLALLVIAANESVMPQTREHLAILDLLGVDKGIVAITKKDLVDEEWLSLVRMEIEELIATTTLAQAPIIAVSALTGEGLDELTATIDRLLQSTAVRKDTGRPRLIIDRVFTLPGSGTIVTGTLIDGSLSAGQEVEIIPPSLKSRLRGLQTHKTRINTATPGSRVAANLVGINTSQLRRGDVLTTPGWLLPTTLVSVQLRLLPHVKRPIRHNTTVSLHTGATEAMAKVRLLEGDKLESGDNALAQMSLDSPIAAVNGDHFIIRSPMETLGGGRILDAHTKRLRRYRAAAIQSLQAREEGKVEEIILNLLESKQPLEFKALLSQCDLPVEQAQPLIESLVQQAEVISIGQGEHRLLFTATGWERLIQKAKSVVQEYHRNFPVRSGMPKVELNNKLSMAKYPAVLPRLIDGGFLREKGSVVRLPAHKIQLNQSQQNKVDAFLDSLIQNPYSPPSELIPEPDLLNLLIEGQQVVKTGDNVVFSTSAYNDMVDKIAIHLKKEGKITLAEVRDMFQTTRKYAQALLEYLDSKKITRRVGDERVIY